MPSAGPIHLAIVSREFPPFFGGGIGSYTQRWSWALVREGHRATVITVSADGREHREEREGVVVVRLPFLKGQDWSGPHPAIASERTRRAFRVQHPVSVFAMQVAGALPRLAVELGFDAVEFPDTGALGWYAARAGRSAGGRLPMVTVVHSPSAWVARLNRERVDGRAMRALMRMEGHQARWSDAVLAPSSELAGEARGLWGLGRGAVAVVPYPLGPLEEVARQARAGAGGGGPRRVLFAGRLEPRKGIDTLLSAFASAVSAGADLELDVAGEDTPHPDRPGVGFGVWAYGEAVPGPVRGRVRMLGKQSPAALAELLRVADVAVIPSPTDNFPGTCMEAMSAAKVVIASRAGGMAEMIEDGASGVLFTPGDAAALSAALVNAAAMSAARAAELGEGARRRMLEVCGNAAVVRRRVEHLRGVIAGSAGRRATRGQRAADWVRTWGLVR